MGSKPNVFWRNAVALRSLGKSHFSDDDVFDNTLESSLRSFGILLSGRLIRVVRREGWDRTFRP